VATKQSGSGDCPPANSACGAGRPAGNRSTEVRPKVGRSGGSSDAFGLGNAQDATCRVSGESFASHCNCRLPGREEHSHPPGADDLQQLQAGNARPPYSDLGTAQVAVGGDRRG
jgi:hypothetical protein